MIAVERRIRGLGIGCTFPRPNRFFQGFLTPRTAIAMERRPFAPIGDARVGAVDVGEIAAVAVTALTELGHPGKIDFVVDGPIIFVHGAGMSYSMRDDHLGPFAESDRAIA